MNGVGKLINITKKRKMKLKSKDSIRKNRLLLLEKLNEQKKRLKPLKRKWENFLNMKSK